MTIAAPGRDKSPYLHSDFRPMTQLAARDRIGTMMICCIPLSMGGAANRSYRTNRTNQREASG
jgi:hypothetical protein